MWIQLEFCGVSARLDSTSVNLVLPLLVSDHPLVVESCPPLLECDHALEVGRELWAWGVFLFYPSGLKGESETRGLSPWNLQSGLWWTTFSLALGPNWRWYTMSFQDCVWTGLYKTCDTPFFHRGLWGLQENYSTCMLAIISNNN